MKYLNLKNLSVDLKNVPLNSLRTKQKDKTIIKRSYLKNNVKLIKFCLLYNVICVPKLIGKI